MFGDPGEHLGAKLLMIVEGKYVVRPPHPGDNSVGAALTPHLPTYPLQRGKHTACPAGRPCAHAASTKRSPTSGTCSPCSIRSANVRSARTSTLPRASAREEPYAMTPGKAGTSASQRPSSSCSNSITSMPITPTKTERAYLKASAAGTAGHQALVGLSAGKDAVPVDGRLHGHLSERLLHEVASCPSNSRSSSCNTHKMRDGPSRPTTASAPETPALPGQA